MDEAELLLSNAVAFVACALLSQIQLVGAEKPNVIFLFADDQAYDTLGCYGNPDVKTPNIDRLAEQGVVFDRHYNTTAICMASRANVMTGLLEYKSGCNFMHGPMAAAIWNRSYPVSLREAGYRTGFAGKFGFAVTTDPTDGASENKYENLPLDDFDSWAGGIGQTSYDTGKNKYLAEYADRFPHSTRAYGAFGQDFIRESVESEKPFCLSIFFKAPHRPPTPDPAFDHVYESTEFRKLPNYGRPAGEHLAEQSRMGRQYPRFKSWGYSTEEGYQKALRLYHQQIYGIDYAVGMIVEELEARGAADNTIIVYSSDNGFFNGSHGMGSKVLPYEEGARVPLIVFDPRLPPEKGGRRSGAVTGNVDIAATLLDAAGIGALPDMDGKSVMPIVRGEEEQVREYLPLIQVWGTAGTFSLGIVTEDYKYIYWPYGEEFEPTEELLDLIEDPYEMSLANSPEVLGKLRGYYREALEDWSASAVPYNDYLPFAKILDPEIPWANKKELVPSQFSSGMDYYNEKISD